MPRAKIPACIFLSLELFVNMCVIALDLVNSDPKTNIPAAPIPTPTLPDSINREADEPDWIHVV
jgi:hypothetical protein